MNDGLKHRVIVVTGAGSGLGRAIAVAFAKAGAHVVVADITLGGAQTTTAGIGDTARAVAVDISDETSLAQMVAQVVKVNSALSKRKGER